MKTLLFVEPVLKLHVLNCGEDGYKKSINFVIAWIKIRKDSFIFDDFLLRVIVSHVQKPLLFYSIVSDYFKKVFRKSKIELNYLIN